jgi:hypothetical protein
VTEVSVPDAYGNLHKGVAIATTMWRTCAACNAMKIAATPSTCLSMSAVVDGVVSTIIDGFPVTRFRGLYGAR